MSADSAAAAAAAAERVELQPWFHADATRASAEALLVALPPNSFLVRASSQPNCYALSQVISAGVVKHSLIVRTDLGRVSLEGTTKSFANVDSLVRALKLEPVFRPGATVSPDLAAATTAPPAAPAPLLVHIPHFPTPPQDDFAQSVATVAKPVAALGIENKLAPPGAYTVAPPAAATASATQPLPRQSFANSGPTSATASPSPPLGGTPAARSQLVGSAPNNSAAAAPVRQQPPAHRGKSPSPPPRAASPQTSAVRSTSPPLRTSVRAASPQPLPRASARAMSPTPAATAATRGKSPSPPPRSAASPPPKAASPVPAQQATRASPPSSSGSGVASSSGGASRTPPTLPLKMSPVPVPANVRTSSRPRANDAAAPTPASPLLNHQNDVDANAQLVSDLDRAAIAEHAAFHKKATQCAFAIPSNTLFGHARRDAVMRSVLTRELVVLLALRDAVPATERDELCESLVLLLEPSNAALYAIEAIVAVEVAGTLSEGTLFRTNSIASKMMQCYSKRLPDGAAYLRAVLDPLIRDVCSGRYGSLEVNPDHASAGDDPARNMQTLIHLAQAFLNAVLDGVHQMPIGLQHLCAHLRACVQQRFASDAGSNAVLSVIGGFLFLRFFCPAIVSPETHGFVDEPPHRDVRRILVLVSKALQNLANRTAFREKYMGAMNAFLEQNQQKVVDYLRDAAVLIHSSGSVPVRQAVPDDERDAAFTRVHRLAAPRLPDIEARARVLFPSMLEAALEQTRTFATAMAELGAPPPLAAAGANDSSSNLTSLARTQQAAAAAAATAQKSGGKGGFFGKLSKRSAAKRSVRDAQALFHALDIGDDAGAIQLLSKNEELLMARNDNGMTPIILAANHGNAALVKYLLELKADCFVADMNGWTVLHAACFAKRDDIVDDLLNESHIDVSAKNEDGNTPLHYFARSKHDPLVAKKLLRTFAARGADLNARNNIGDTPLHAAAWKGNIQMAQALLRAGASALLRNDDGQSARTIARVTENHELDAVLDEAGAPRHTLDRKTELATAGGRPAPGPLSPRGGGGGGGGGGADGPESPRGRGSSGGGAAAAAAAAATATTTATTASGSTSPVLEGRSSGRGRPASPTLVATLRDSSILQSSASTGKEQFLADVVACRVTAVRNALGGSHRETLLRARGAHGATPMHLLAASGGDPRAVSLAEHLVKLGGDVNAVDDGGFTPIILAVYRNNQPVLRVLMASSIVNVAAANNAGCTAFHYLPRLSPFDRQTVRTLLAMANAPIDAPNKSGDTPLMLAAASGALDACELLLAAGAVPLRRNSTRQTAIDLAQAAGRTDVVSILQEAQRKQPSMFNVVQQSGEYGIVRPNSQADEGYDALPGERSAVDASGENPYGITPLPPPVDENYHAAPLPLEAAIDDDDVDAVRGGAASEYGALPSFRDVPVPIPREELPEVFLDDLTDLPDLPPAPPTTGDDDE